MSKTSNHDGRRPRKPAHTQKSRASSPSRAPRGSFAGKDRRNEGTAYDERPKRAARPQREARRHYDERPDSHDKEHISRDKKHISKNRPARQRHDQDERQSFGADKAARTTGPRTSGAQKYSPRAHATRPARFDRRDGPRTGEAARPSAPAASSTMEGERIAKVMARVGLCSRRDAEMWIEQGRVSVNGEVLSSPARNVLPADRILVDGQQLAQRERTRLFLFNKPRGLVTTDRDPEGRTTVFSALPAWMPRVVSIGRLDINTEGLLLLTNDGGLARQLELPATGWLRRYRVRANGSIDQARLDALRGGVSIEGIDYAGIEAKLDRVQGANVWLTMGLREGKNREIKRVLEHLGLAVNRLIRLSFGPFQLGELAEGDVEEIKTRILRDQIGTALAAEAGCDFDGPIISSPESFALLAHPQHIARPHHRPSHERANGRQRAFERDAEDELPPRKDRPPPRARKHISALRADQKPQQGRRPIARSTTADRKGRDVAVERVSSQRPTIRSGKSRNEKRFSQERAQQNRAERSERPTHHGDGNRSASNRTASTKNAPTRSGPNRGGPNKDRPNRGGPNKDRPNRGPSKRGGPQRPRRFD